MLTFYHYPLCPFSRAVRLLLAECGIETKLQEEVPWEWRPEFLQFNPSGRLPVLVVQDGPTLCGSYVISEYMDDTGLGATEAAGEFVPFPGQARDRAEVRRLVDWFHVKFDADVSTYIFGEKIQKRFAGAEDREPDMAVLRAGYDNLDYHMRYIDHLARERRWLAGDHLSYADFAAAGHISFIDYLGDIPWDEHADAKEWYARIKSRPSYRVVVADRVPWLKPPEHYANPDY